MTNHRVYNFSPGPSALPQPVLERARDELMDWRGLGLSVMEVSHRSREFIECARQAESDLRELIAIPSDYKVLFLAGGATMQFAAVPLNISKPGDGADYIITGNWGKKAASEARRYVNVNVAADSSDSKFTGIPERTAWKLDPNAAYVHYTPNETVYGVEFHSKPDVGSVPLVADVSSTLLSRPIDVAGHGILYGGAQKNMGIAGLGVAIIRGDLIGKARPETPGVIDYQTMADSDSMWNTPPSFAWYMAGLVFQWLKAQGGVSAIEQINRRKAEKLYAAIDKSDFFSNPVALDCRSRMNVPFTLADPALDSRFLEEALEAGMSGLKGHRSIGGMRASIYNAMPEEGVDALIAFMADFEARVA